MFHALIRFRLFPLGALEKIKSEPNFHRIQTISFCCVWKFLRISLFDKINITKLIDLNQSLKHLRPGRKWLLESLPIFWNTEPWCSRNFWYYGYFKANLKRPSVKIDDMKAVEIILLTNFIYLAFSPAQHI